MALTSLNRMTAAHWVCSKYRAISNPIAGPAYLTNLFEDADGTGVPGTIAYMRTVSVRETREQIARTLGLPRYDGPETEKEASPLPASGKSFTLAGSLGGSHGEFIERFAGLYAYLAARRAGKIILASTAEMRRQGLRVVGPESLELFAPEQYDSLGFPFVPFEESSRIGWIDARTVDGEVVWLPAVLAFMAYREEEGEARIAYPTTGGLCYADTEVDGINTGLLELIERDAINLCWIAGIPPRKIENVEDVALSRLRREQSELLAFSPYTDVPYVEVVHTQYFDFLSPLFLGGGGISASLEGALAKALLEIKQCAHATVFLRGRMFDMPSEQVNDFFDIVPHYSHPERLQDLKTQMDDVLTRVNGVRLRSLRSTARKPDSQRTVRTAQDLAKMEAVTGPIYFLSFDVASIGLPGVVIRCVVPGLSLAGVPRAQFLGHKRYYQAYQTDSGDHPARNFVDLNLGIMPFP